MKSCGSFYRLEIEMESTAYQLDFVQREETKYKEEIKKEIRLKQKRTVTALILLAPSLIFLCIFTIYPIFQSIYSSFFIDNLSTIKPRFCGLDNYVKVFSDEIFWECFWNNLLIAVVTIPVSIGLAVCMAIFTERLVHGKALARLACVYPTFIPLVAAANIWLFIYTPMYGLLGNINPSWRFLADAKTANWAIMIMLIWKQTGYIMLFYAAGLQGVSKEVLEAAKIDGADSFHTFCHVTWPLLKPTTMYVFVIVLTNAYKMVDHLYIMTKGGPGNATNVLLFYIYQTGFDYWDNGKASTMTVLLVGLLLLVSCFQFFRQEKTAHYE